MNALEVIKGAETALAIISEGRAALASIMSAVNDGKAEIDADTHAQLDVMLAQEEAQTKAAIADLRSAIAEYRADK